MRKTIVFDLGGVLINWDPRNMYRKLFDDEDEMNAFLSDVCHPQWNARQDAGETLTAATAERIAVFPDKKDLIEAYYDRWVEMLDGSIPETVDIFRELKAFGEPIYALTNWSGETFPTALKIFDFLHWFEGTIVSGDEKLVKPDPAIFYVLLERFNLNAESCLFIDDSIDNIKSANQLGFDTHHFTNPQGLRARLDADGLL
jgi:2-haloacid dehalogenase